MFAALCKRIALWVSAVTMTAVAHHAAADVAVPPLSSPVTDLTQTLTREQVASLEQTLRAFEARKGSQIAVLMLPTTQPESIEQYAIRVAEAWKIGRKDINDGVIFLIAKDDRAMRIEVGYGLEGALPDAIASRIIRQEVTPHFRNGEFYLGIVAGVDRIVRTIDGEPLPEPTRRDTNGGDKLGNILPVLLVMVFVVGGILRSVFGRLGGASVVSLIVGLVVWLLISTVAVAVIAAIAAFFFTLFGGGGGGWSSGRRGRGWGGGFGSGGFGGGWSGGGGGFGGGGASGRW